MINFDNSMVGSSREAGFMIQDPNLRLVVVGGFRLSKSTILEAELLAT